MAERSRTYQRNLRRRVGLTNLAARFADANGTKVLRGPFKGLEYPPALLGSQVDAPIAKLLGTYELELHGAIEQSLADAPKSIVDLGSADGYYAVGMAMRSPGSKIHAFELARSARNACRHVAQANGVQIDLRGIATARRLRQLPLDGALACCDIEGAEAAVFDEAAISALETATVLVELHEPFVPGVTQLLRHRFSRHGCTIIRSQDRDSAQSELCQFTPKERALAVSEFRGGPMAWALFRPD